MKGVAAQTSRPHTWDDKITAVRRSYHITVRIYRN